MVGTAAGMEGVDIRAVVAATQAVVDMEAGRCMWLAGVVVATAAVHRTWLAVGIAVAVDMEAVRTLTAADKP
jgi:recombinational DNA repair protein RecR